MPHLGTYLWRLPAWANHKFELLMDELIELDSHEDRFYAVQDEIRSLPGFPTNSNDYKLIRRQVTTGSSIRPS